MEFYALLYKEIAYYRKNVKTVIYNCISTIMLTTILIFVSKYIRDEKICELIKIYAIYFMPVSVIMGNIASSIMFESFDNMLDFLFSQGIKKSYWMFVKLLMGIGYGMCILIIPYIESVLFLKIRISNLFQYECNLVIMGMVVSLLTIFIRIQPFVWVSIVFQFVNWLVIALLLPAYANYNAKSFLLSAVIILIMWGINIVILRKKETKINIDIKES